MSMQITVTLSDEIYNQAEHLAQLTSRNIADVLADTIELSLSPLVVQSETFKPVESLTDEEVLTLTELEMPSSQDQRLSKLLNRQQAGILTLPEQSELLALMQVYQENLLQKARALREAVQRGLREPLAT